MIKNKLIFGLSLALFVNISSYKSTFGNIHTDITHNLMLVNKEYRLDETYEPKDIVDMADNILMTKNSILLEKETAQALKDMDTALKLDGFEGIVLVSGYRTYEYQKGLYNTEISKYKNMPLEKAEQEASQVVAPMGSSEHQSGLTFDISTMKLVRSGNILTQDFSKTDIGKWVADNCADYGFILRYEESKMDITDIIFEPWHFRYVGKPHAKIMKDKNMCLEEYLEFLKTEKSYIYDYDDLYSYGIYYTDNIDNLDYENIQDISIDGKGGYIVTTYGEKDAIHNNVNIFMYPIRSNRLKYVLNYNSFYKTDIAEKQ